MLKLKSRRNPTFSDDPFSPKVTCMGQVKRNNRVAAAGLPPCGGAAITHHQNYSMLKKLFSSKSLLPLAKSRVCVDNLTRLNLKKECVNIVDIGKLDPPLPVVKRAAPPPEVSLWRRRTDGAALEKLQIVCGTAI